MKKSKHDWVKTQFRLIAVNLIVLLVTYFLVTFAKKNPHLTEYIYSRKMYLFLSNTLSFFAKSVKFSIGEVLLFMIGIGLIVLIIYAIYNLLTKQILKSITLFIGLMTCVSVSVLLFNVLWGLNNYRQEAELLFELDTNEEITIDVLTDLYSELISRANELRPTIEMNQYNEDDIFQSTYRGYEALHKHYPFISDKEVRVKPLFISPLFSSSGYTGVYLFFAGEPCINDMPPIYEIPFTASHEVAHHKGFASEDEANLIGFLASISQEDPLFQYSGYYTAMKYVGNAIKKYDSDLYYELASLINEDVKHDIQQENEFWSDAIVERNQKVHNKINDQFLKVNNQPEGILNYSRVVELLALSYIKGLF